MSPSTEKSGPDGPTEPSWREALALPLGLVGAMGGAALGGFLFRVLWERGLYAPLVVGGLAGFGCIALARRGGMMLGILAAVIALGGSLVAEWSAAPFRADPSLAYFLGHVHELTSMHILGHGADAALAWVIVQFTPPAPGQKVPSEPREDEPPEGAK